MSGHPVAAQGWPPQITAEIRCLQMRQRGAKTAVQGVSGNHPRNLPVTKRLTHGLCLGDPLYILLAL